MYKQSNAYVRYIEPLDVDLARQVEYDMDEQGGGSITHLLRFLTEYKIKSGWTISTLFGLNYTLKLSLTSSLRSSSID